jgi:Mg-chelatase subunit ChlD
MEGGGAGRGQGHSPSDPAQADPTALIAEVEPYAANLARLLRPPEVYAGRRPHHSRGDLDVERALRGADRFFEARLGQAPKPSEAWFILIDVSASMQSAHRPATAMAGALRAAMWLVVAAERARIAIGVGAFDDQPTMIRIRDLAIGSDPPVDRRLAGLDHGGGTRLAPALEQASRTLTHFQAHRKLLVVLHDGDLQSADAQATRHLVATLPKRGIHLLPLYLGSDPAVIAANRRVFGDLLACPDLGSLTSLLLSWLRARAS